LNVKEGKGCASKKTRHRERERERGRERELLFVLEAHYQDSLESK
jgi:hypothetical protein